jgi:cold shock CspA family protein
MRTHGTLTRWNDDRGFGFITPAKGPPDIFVHISEFPRGGGRPTLNELISFEVQNGPDGKKRAIRVMRPGQKSAMPPANRARESESHWISRALSFVIVAAIAAYGYSQYTQRRAEARLATMDPVALAAPTVQRGPFEPSPLPSPETIPELRARIAAPASSFSCDGRTMCSQMRSCEEATYFIRSCPGTEMDGDNDGVPCEQQFCR